MSLAVDFERSTRTICKNPQPLFRGWTEYGSGKNDKRIFVSPNRGHAVLRPGHIKIRCGNETLGVEELNVLIRHGLASVILSRSLPGFKADIAGCLFADCWVDLNDNGGIDDVKLRMIWESLVLPGKTREPIGAADATATDIQMTFEKSVSVERPIKIVSGGDFVKKPCFKDLQAIQLVIADCTHRLNVTVQGPAEYNAVGDNVYLRENVPPRVTVENLIARIQGHIASLG